METAAVHYIDVIGGYGPAYLLVIGVLVILSILAIRYMPFWQKCKEKRLDIESDREKRKTEADRMRAEHEAERAAIARSQVEAQERSTAAMNAMTQQMSIIEARLEASQHGSMAMRDKVDDMALEVHDIHTVVVQG